MVDDVAGGVLWSVMWQAGGVWSVLWQGCMIGDVTGGLWLLIWHGLHGR